MNLQSVFSLHVGDEFWENLLPAYFISMTYIYSEWPRKWVCAKTTIFCFLNVYKFKAFGVNRLVKEFARKG